MARHVVDGMIVDFENAYPWGDACVIKSGIFGQKRYPKHYGDDYRETLWKTNSGRYILSRRGRTPDDHRYVDEDHFVTPKEAARWLLLNEHKLPSDLKSYESTFGEVAEFVNTGIFNGIFNTGNDRLTFERDGIIYDTSKANHSWSQKALDPRDRRETLYNSPRGQYYIVWKNKDYQNYGIEMLDLIEAARWLLLNNYELPSDLARYRSLIVD